MMENAALLASAKMQDELTWQWIERVVSVLLKKRELTGYDVFQLKPQGRR